jgi:AraC family transcriptional regulator of adaptative response / DNA-3-methyladenine glycosylase II
MNMPLDKQLTTLPPLDACERARQARDPRYDGRFFIGVLTTGIYCRPVCPARMPAPHNVRFYATAAAASEAGFRPCLRCRPETAPGSPAWRGTSATVTRALALIDNGALDDRDIEGFADRLGVSVRHLNRLFAQHVGASPMSVLNTRRLHFAKRLIDDTVLPMRDIAIAAGYGSVRQFNDDIRRTWQRAPRDLRKQRTQSSSDGMLRLHLSARAPFDGAGVLNWLQSRSIPGVEAINTQHYRRDTNDSGSAAISIMVNRDGIELAVSNAEPLQLPDIVGRARRLFDLGCDPLAVEKVLSADKNLKKILRTSPGIRIPGCWNPFELAVRCVLGQQISVAAAQTLMTRLVVSFGMSPDVLAESPLERIGLTRSRAATLRELSRRAAKGELDFDSAWLLRDQLLDIPGIGPWTAEYICLRAASDPDAFPAGDLALRKALSDSATPIKERELAARAEAWRPWRGYAAMLLWRSLSAAGKTGG